MCLIATGLLWEVGCSNDDDVSADADTSATTSVSARPAPTRPERSPAGALDRFPVPSGAGPHDVAPSPDGTVWYTAQRTGALGRLDPATGKTTDVPLGSGSAPHGVIVGPDGAAWVTDSGLNAIARVDPSDNEVKRFPLPANRANANLNTAAFDRQGTLWFTGQNGVYGRLFIATGAMDVYDA